MIGIHKTSAGFSDRWIEICKMRNIPFRVIDCFSNDILKQCADIDTALWHWHHYDQTAQIIARQIISSMELQGILVFPSTSTCWHFDDKIGQKYLLEAIDAPLIPSWIFYDRGKAYEWISKAVWPKVFKLRSGAGSSNVKLVKSKGEAISLCKRSFGRGFVPVQGYVSDWQTKLRNANRQGNLTDKLLRAPKTLFNIFQARQISKRERGYIYFQDYLPDNNFDTRVTVIGERAFAYQRRNRPNDFRASGSGDPVYNPKQIDLRCIEIAFCVSDRLSTQSLAFDFLFDSQNNPMIGELSYCYVAAMVYDCKGYWDRNGNWHEGHIWPQDAILNDILEKIA